MVEMLRSIVIMATILRNSAFATDSATRCEGALQQLNDDENVFWGFTGRAFERNRTLVVRGEIINATDWFVKVELIQCAKREELGLSDCPQIGLDIGANRENTTRVFRAWKASAIDSIQRTHPGSLDVAMNGWLDLKLNSASRNFPLITANDAEIQTSDLFYCPNCIIKLAYFRLNNVRLEGACYADFDNTGPDYHRLELEQCKDIRQEKGDTRKSYRFGMNESFTEGHQMTFLGTTNKTWSVKLDLLACVQSNGSADDCFSLVFEALPSRNGKDIDCQVSKKGAMSDLLERTHHTFYGLLDNNYLKVQLFNLNNVLRIVFNNFEIRLSTLTYCKGCTIQIVNLQVDGYRLKEVCYENKDGNLRLPPTTLYVGQRYYKNTLNSIKDVILDNLQLGAYEVSWNGSVIGQKWQLKTTLMLRSSKFPKLVFGIAPTDNGATIRTFLHYYDEDGKENFYGNGDMAFRLEEVTDIKVSVQYRSASYGKFRYQFFIDGRNSSQLFTGPAFDRLQFHTHDATVEDVSFLSKERELPI